MAAPAFDESWRLDPILAGGVAPPCGAEFTRFVPPTFSAHGCGPLFSRKVGVVRARAPHPEDLDGLQRGMVASAEPIASRGPVGAEVGGPERAMGVLAEPDASRGPDSARANSLGAGLDGSVILRGAIGAAMVALRWKLIGKSSAQSFSEINTETTLVAPASPPRAVFKFRARSYVAARAQKGDQPRKA
ncbi:unnamed protein product [Prorocentrum cordatum]|uniref:Uncharacterized protein n=1 Tax=Prorocentrum cordatum TaxID=2364126 RepID=A0ABN9PHW0_9DINO|nr:unnamed protein product [Polarella glacialis]